MKKTLVAIAALAAVSAFAQSTVTLGGVVRAGFQKAPDATATTKASTGLTLTDMTLNIGVSEDLGGGLKANAAVTLDQASGAFANALNRRNTSLGLSGGFGSVAFLQTRSSDLLGRGMVAPTNLPEGLYNTSGVVARAPIDHLQYTSPNLSGFTIGAGFTESAADGIVSPTRRTLTLSGGYSNGPLAAGLAFKNTGASNGAVLPVGFRKSNVEGFATYNFGIATVGFGFDGKTNAGGGVTVANADKTALSLGVAAPFGPVTVGLNYAKRGTAKVGEVGLDYALSKRTSFNASFGKQSAGVGGNVAAGTAGTVTAGGVATPAAAAITGLSSQSQYRISVAHTF